ncbi:MAG: hypothetical protein PWQ20_1908 [Thermotogaceae bacterium]|nr:hypothetical protein [Thermotogaceae bacterium]
MFYLENEDILRSKALKISIFEGMLAIVFLVAIQGHFFTKTVLELGGDEWILGVLTSIQFLGQSFQLFVPKIIERIGSRKKFMLFGNGIGRGLWIILILFPLFGLKLSAGILILTIGSSFILMSMASNAWTSWMRDLVPQEIMGSYFGKRNLFVTLTSMASIYTFSMILDARPDIVGIQIILSIALASAFASLWFIQKQYEPPLKESSAWGEVIEAFNNRNFRKLLTFGFYWNFIILFSSPYFSYHLLENMKFQFKYIGYFSLISSTLSMLFYLIWGKLADKIGHKNIFRIGASGAVVLATMWGFMTPKTVWQILFADSVLAAFAWSAINISLFTIPILVSGKSTSVYISLFATFSGIGGFLGSLVGGAVAKALSDVHVILGGLEFWGVQFMFIAAGVLRAISIVWMDRVNVVGHVSLRNYLFVGFSNITRRVISGISEQPPVTRMVKYVRHIRQISKKEKEVL